ncbi:MAG: NADH-quinone oxidoreductase subunit L [Fimbriiglobus sp.]
MFEQFQQHPGRLYVVAALLPLLPAALILLANTAKNLARPAAARGGFAAWVYLALGGGKPQVWGAYLSVACVALAAVCGIVGVYWQAVLAWYRHSRYHGDHTAESAASWCETWGWLHPPMAERIEWARFGATVTSGRTAGLSLGYSVDVLVALLFAMITVIAAVVFVFALGYMADERRAKIEDHEAHVKRRGRFGLFFVYLSLFVSAMLNLLIADNLFQIFWCWELVGVCSFFLIGFFTEQVGAAGAATKAFLVNRVGDAGFLVAITIAWGTFGTLNLSEIAGYSGPLTLPVWARFGAGELPMLGLGLGLFLGCMGKSAQVPLHVWLPDAMAGPTPVSALIHAATMVAAGVYLAARCSFLFTPDVLTFIAYTGAITAFFAATAACVQTDIKRVLAYSTCSQLGLMMLGIGLGNNTAALFHLLTHAFFKALLFLAAGSVIHGLHHEQDLRKMGGLRRRMPITAYTMLVGVLAISGFPFLSGWYSKGLILSAAWEHAHEHPTHAALYALPMITAGLTAFYMFRLWFLTFTGESRSDAVEHARESPPVMTLPLVVLAGFSVVAGWGWPVWDPHSSAIVRVLEPPRLVERRYDPAYVVIEAAAGVVAAVGFGIAYWRYRVREIVPTDPRGVRSFFSNAGYFDAVHRVLIVRPMVGFAAALAAVDRRPGASDADGGDPTANRPGPRTLDGWLSLPAVAATGLGAGLRRAQTGRIRGYVLALGLTVAGLLGMLVAR